MDRLGALFLRVCIVSAGCSAVLAPLLLFFRKLQKKFTAKTFYVLFLLLALRLVLPVEIRLPVPAVELSAPDLTLSVPAAAPAAPRAGQPVPDLSMAQAPVQAAPQPEKKVPVLHIFGAVWAFGALCCAAFSAGSYALVRKKLLDGSKPAGADESGLLERLVQKLGVGRPVSLRRSAAAPGPLALGLVRPVILLPEDGRPAEELVLRHELTHIRRWDIAYKLLLSLACWVNWFNPLVWLLDRSAGRNLELCCDDEVTRDLSDAQRRRYGSLLLDAAAERSIPFSTCFSGGKTQMKERLLNLFTQKRNSAALVCLVLAAALLAGGLVACEQAPAAQTPKVPDAEPMGAGSALFGSPAAPSAVQPSASEPENGARRALFKDYFYQNYTEDSASVVLADLTGDGLDELLVLTMESYTGGAVDLRQPVDAEQFSYGKLTVCGVQDGVVFQYNSICDVASAHAGWRYVYLVPRSDGNGFALLDFSPYTGQGMANYAYGVHALEPPEKDEWRFLDGGEANFSLDPVGTMDPDTGDDATPEEVQALLDRVQAYRDSGVALLCFYSDGAKNEFSYLNAAPADAFAGKFDTLPALTGCVVTNGYTAQIPLPPAGPSSPEEALEALTASAQAYEGGYVFRLPNYEGDWNVQVAGRMRMGGEESDDYMSVHYLEDAEWVPGQRYCVETNGAYFDDLTLTASVTCHNGAHAEHTICLEGTDEHALVHHDEGELHHVETHVNVSITPNQDPDPAQLQTIIQGTHHPETHHSGHHN